MLGQILSGARPKESYVPKSEARLPSVNKFLEFYNGDDDPVSCSMAMTWILSSIITSVVTIGAFTSASLQVILKIRGASDEIQALINEISDLSAIIKDVEHTLRYNKAVNADKTGTASLYAVESFPRQALPYILYMLS
ncbi:MAG: hypothetical protein Q9215_006181 [Flavoplaca cf. flavocitrina]